MDCLPAYKQYGCAAGYCCHGPPNIRIAPGPFPHCCEDRSGSICSSDTATSNRTAFSKAEKTPAMQKLSTHLKLGKKKPVKVDKAQDDAVERISKLQKPFAKLKKRNTAASKAGESHEHGNRGDQIVQDFEFELVHARLFARTRLASNDDGRREHTGASNMALQVNLDPTAAPARSASPGPMLPSSDPSSSSEHDLSKISAGPSDEAYEDALVSWQRALCKPIVASQESTDQTAGGEDRLIPDADSNSVQDQFFATLIRRETYCYHTLKCAAIRDTVDWSQFGQSDLPGLFKSYSSDISPTDSAVEIQKRSSIACDEKGKGRAIHDASNDPCRGDNGFSAEVTEGDHAKTERMINDFLQPYSSDERSLNLTEASWKLIRDLKQLDLETDRRIALQLQERFDLERQEEESLAAERAIAARIRDCIVCGDSKDIDDFPVERTTSTCDHSVNVCSECLRAWMTSEFDTKGVSGIGCPECREPLSHNDVQRAASAETFAAYDKVTTRQALANLPGFEWCLGADCGSGQLNENEHNPNFMQCASCKYMQCLKHKTAWHSDETCEQYDYRTSGKQAEEEAKTEAMLNNISKLCPGPPGKDCGWRIQKTDGCDHMTCRKCKHQFCWQCLAGQDEIRRVGNTAHKPECKFHSHNLDIAWPFNVH